MTERVLVAMSGGVDSSVAALLLNRAGYEVVGVTAKLFGSADVTEPSCGSTGVANAREVCNFLGIEHHEIDLTREFERRVIQPFVAAYRVGRTPNPCSDCNRFIKFDLFFEYAHKWGCSALATGHYARLVRRGDGPPLLCQAHDLSKDQSYFLAGLPPVRLAHIRFPNGEFTKEQIRVIAQEAELPTSTLSESQDICFLQEASGIIQLLSRMGQQPQPGNIVDEQSRVLGRHPGIEHFTIGQRKGLQLGGGTEGLVVHRLEPDSATVVVAPWDAHPIAGLLLSDYTDLAPGLWQPGQEVRVRARYRQKPWPAEVAVEEEHVVVVSRDEQFGAALGQWVVGYRDGTVLFGGVIDQVRYRR